MKLREMDALVKQLQKKGNPEQEVTLVVPSPFGALYVAPAIVPGKDSFYIIPAEATEDLKEECGRAEIGQCLSDWQKEQEQDMQAGQA